VGLCAPHHIAANTDIATNALCLIESSLKFNLRHYAYWLLAGSGLQFAPQAKAGLYNENHHPYICGSRDK
jgi:hypothetical protein